MCRDDKITRINTKVKTMLLTPKNGDNKIAIALSCRLNNFALQSPIEFADHAFPNCVGYKDLVS